MINDYGGYHYKGRKGMKLAARLRPSLSATSKEVPT